MIDINIGNCIIKEKSDDEIYDYLERLEEIYNISNLYGSSDYYVEFVRKCLHACIPLLEDNSHLAAIVALENLKCNIYEWKQKAIIALAEEINSKNNHPVNPQAMKVYNFADEAVGESAGL